MAHLRVQEYLDDVSELDIPSSQTEWYNVDVASLLPADNTYEHGFDNNGEMLSISPDLVSRYLSAARKISRLAVGTPPVGPAVATYRIHPGLLQDDRQGDRLSFGSRGGIAVRHYFPVDGEYLLKIQLRRQYQDYLMGMGWQQQLDVRLDGELLERFAVGGGATEFRPAASSYAGAGEPGSAGAPEWEEYMQSTGDAHLEVRLMVEAGPRVVGVSFVREQWEPELLPQPQQRGRVLTNDQIYMDNASVGSVQIGGPYEITGATGDTPSRTEIFVCHPEPGMEEEACATQIFARIARRAYRRATTGQDVEILLQFFRQGRSEGGSFDAGIQLALERLVVDPEFLFRIYREPIGVEQGDAYELDDVEVASRLSFFLWSSIPDETLLELAEEGRLTEPAVLEEQVRRMRGWMAARGERDKPLYITEYGILMPAEAGFTPSRVINFMIDSFDLLDSLADENLGYPQDENRLVQRWVWFSTRYHLYPSGDLFNTEGTPLPPLRALSGYIRAHTK